MKFRSINPIVRSIAVFGSVAAMVTGVTFAALSSNNVVLADSDFSTATAELQIWDGVAGSYGVTAPGFNLTNLLPETESSEVTFWLKNNGTAPLTVRGLGTIDGYTGFTDFSKVDVKVRNITAGTGYTTYTFAALLDTTPDALPGNPLAAGAANEYGVTITIDQDALAGSSANVNNFDWTFTGTNP